MLFQPRSTDSVEDPQRAETVDIARVFRHFKRNLDVRLGAEVVDLGRLDLGDNVGQVGGVGKVTVVQDHLYVSNSPRDVRKSDRGAKGSNVKNSGVMGRSRMSALTSKCFIAQAKKEQSIKTGRRHSR